MNKRLYFLILFKLFVLFGVATAATYVPDHLRDFFGDTLLRSGEWDWGKRHYIYAIFSGAAFILTIVDSIVFCNRFGDILAEEREKDKLKNQIKESEDLTKLIEEQRDRLWDLSRRVRNRN
jgi:hypothetical protein